MRTGSDGTGRPDALLAAALRRDALLSASLLAGYVAFGAAFRGPRERFWQRMTLCGAALGGLALVADPALRRVRVRPRDAAAGLGVAIALYAAFDLGDRVLRRLVPAAAGPIEDLYALRHLRPPAEIAARIALVIAPAEELFWRGLVQRRLTRVAGRWPAAALAAAAYAGAHVAAGNPALVGAAAAAGGAWSGLAAAGMPMEALVASHVLWDLWVFLVSPTGPDGGRD